ncbi:MAG: hypothetical protein WBE79_10050 [Candidatus Cybelea sp.]
MELDTQNLRNGRDEILAPRERRQFNEPDAVVEGIEQIRCGLQRDPRLTNATRPDKRHKRRLFHQRRDHGHNRLTPDQRSQLARQIVQGDRFISGRSERPRHSAVTWAKQLWTHRRRLEGAALLDVKA